MTISVTALDIQTGTATPPDISDVTECRLPETVPSMF